MRWIQASVVMAALAAFANATLARAQGTPAGAPVCNGPAHEAAVLVQPVPEFGGALRVFYVDFTTDDLDIGVGSMSAGNYMIDVMPVLGLPVVQRPGYQGDLAMSEVGPVACATQWPCHPVVLAYGDEVGTECVLRARRLFDSADWDVPVSPPAQFAVAPRVVRDGGAGAYVAWIDRSGPSQRLYMQHVAGDGTLSWDPAGVRICTVESWQEDLEILPDASGGVYAVWTDQRVGRLDLYATHFDAAGARGPGWPDTGRVVQAGLGLRLRTKLVADGSGGAYVAWLEAPPLSPVPVRSIRMLRLMPDATIPTEWPAQGLNTLAVPDGVLLDLEDAAADGLGGVVLAMLRNEGTAGALDRATFTRIGPDAARPPGWPAAGVPGSSSAGQQLHVKLIGHLGSLTAVWEEDFDGSPGTDIVGARFGADGSRSAGWSAGGQLIGGGGVSHESPLIGPDASDGAIVVWTQTGIGDPSDYDIYGQTVNAQGVLDVPGRPRPASGVSVSLASRNPSRSGFRFELRLRAASAVRAEVLDVLGRRVATLAEGMRTAGVHPLAWDGRRADGEAAAAGLYFVRVRAPEGIASVPVVVAR